jgi:hypothetical protein
VSPFSDHEAPEPECPGCHGPYSDLLGVLGTLVWFRCRSCGVEHHERL